MRRRALLLLAGLLLLAACGGEVPPLAPLAADATVLAFGDSLTAGTGARGGEDYPTVLAGLTGLSVVNAGIPGETSPQGLARLPGILEEHAPALVILCLGGNDMLRKLDLAATQSNLREMVKLIRAAGAEVVMLGVPQPRLLLLSAAEFYEPLAVELGVPIELDALPEILSDNDLKADPFHPNAAGYRQLAEAIRDLLVESGAL